MENLIVSLRLVRIKEVFTVRFSLTLILLTAIVLLPAGCGGSDSSVEQRFITIGTGGQTGVYYPVGGAIARLVNRNRDTHGVRASYEATGGSVYNINAILAGDMDIGIVQSDRQYQAYDGLAEWEGKGAQTQLRSICSLYIELVTIVAADDAGITTLEDLRGKRVNIGNPGSGQRGNAMDVLQAVGIDIERDLHVEGLKAAESAQMLQDGKIDAFFYTVGHPAGAIMEATAGQRRKVRFVPIVGMDELMEKSPYYTPSYIPIKLYDKAANKSDVPTIGVTTTVVTSADVPEEVVYEVAKAIFGNLDEFRASHEALKGLNVDDMLKGLAAPLHDGVMRYLKEAGLADKAPEAIRP